MIMKRATILLALLAAVGTAAVLWQRLSITELREPAPLLASGVESNVASSAAMNSELEREAVELRAQTRDLPKLRTEVSQLRVRQRELATARVEHERLLRAKESGAPVPREIPPGFVSREQLRNAGYETPEDTIQTFFWAMREGNAAVAMESLSPENKQRIRFDSVPPEQREALELKARGGAPEMKQFNDFNVAERQQLSEDKVKLYLRSSLSTNTVSYELKRFGTEWKLVDF